MRPVHVMMLCPVFLAERSPMSAASDDSKPTARPTPLGETYVLMVSSMHPPFVTLNDDHVRALNATPFDGVAVDILDQYDGSPVPEEGSLLRHCRHVRRVSSKRIWPRIYLNRIIEVSADMKARQTYRNLPYFAAIKGMDLYDEAKALSDFYLLWRSSLRMARALGAPGIVLDVESYNHGQAEQVLWIAERQGKTTAEVMDRLKAVGVRLADITSEEFPQAVVWSLFTLLDRPDQYPVTSGRCYLAASYLFMGLLERASQKRIPLVLISGGESGGYYYPSVEAMRSRFAARNTGFRPWLDRYPKHLKLGATITIWGDARNNTGWALEAATANTPYRHVLDFKPLLAEMFRTYRYVWFYVPMVTDYRPLHLEESRATNERIAELLRRTRPPSGGRRGGG